MRKMNTAAVAVIGAGPAGAMCAYELAKAGAKVALFDHKVPWEKPCGGMLSKRVFDEFSVMREYPYPLCKFHEITLISNRRDAAVKDLRSQLYTVSRRDLGRHLLDAAVAQGAVFFPEKVQIVEKDKKRWKVISDGIELVSDFLVGADGAGGIVKRSTGAVSAHTRQILACGYSIEKMDERCIIKFIEGIGYIWSYPRPHDVCLGIGCIGVKLKKSRSSLFADLSDMIKEMYPTARIRKKWSHTIPLAMHDLAYKGTQWGDGWYMIGDAACNVNPLTGEGIYYAMKSGAIAAECILNKLDYNEYWESSIGAELKYNVALLNRLRAMEENMGNEFSGALYEVMYRNAI